jgi:hypothetical protein
MLTDDQECGDDKRVDKRYPVDLGIKDVPEGNNGRSVMLYSAGQLERDFTHRYMSHRSAHGISDF